MRPSPCRRIQPKWLVMWAAAAVPGMIPETDRLAAVAICQSGMRGEATMKNYLLKKSVREELERRGISYSEYMAERNALRAQARQAKATERAPGQSAAAATKPEEAIQLQREVRTDQGRIREPARTAPVHREPAESGPATWLQLPAINIGPQVDVVGVQYYQEALEAVAAGRNAFGTRTRVLTVALVREPDNPYDANAVRVEAAEATVGHLSRDDAPRFHAITDRLASAGSLATCRAACSSRQAWPRPLGQRSFHRPVLLPVRGSVPAMKVPYNKLVRDRIPEIIRADGHAHPGPSGVSVRATGRASRRSPGSEHCARHGPARRTRRRPRP